MSVHLGHLLAGLGAGAVLAALALGLVVAHRASGVVNFAHAAIGLYLASAFFELRTTGDLVLPVLGLPARLPVVDRPTVVTAAGIVALLAALVGVAVHRLVVRPLRHAPVVAQVAATLGLLLYLQELVRLRFPQEAVRAWDRRSVLPRGSVELLGTAVGTDRLVLAGLAVATGAALWAVQRWTRLGLAMRAAADDEQGAALVGLSAQRLAGLAWAVSALLAGAAVVLAEPISGIGPTTSLLVVPALAAALPGGLRSIPLAVAGGLALGMVQSLLLGWAVGPDGAWLPNWVPVTGLQEALPVIVVLAVLARRGDVLAPRGASIVRSTIVAARAPTHVRRWTLVGVVGAGAALVVSSGAERQALIVSMTFALLCLSVVVVTGLTGQLSLFQLALAGVAGLVALRVDAVGLPFPVAALVGVGAATAVGVLAGWPTTRLRGVSVAVATLTLGVAIERLVLQSSALSRPSSAATARPSVLGIDLSLRGTDPSEVRLAYGLLVLAVLAAACVAVALVRKGRLGREWLAVRSSERAAAAAGVSVRTARLQALALGSVLAGVAGVLVAYASPGLSSQSFMAVGSVVAVALTALAGVTRIGGALLAGALAQSGIVTTLLDRLGGPGADHVLALSGAALVVTMVLRPGGLLDGRRTRARREAVAPRAGSGAELAAPGAELPGRPAGGIA